MRQADHFVPISDVGKETHNLILLESPPPYRKYLQIDVGTLTGLLGMAGAEKDQLKLGFERRQNVVRAAPSHAGRLAATTKETRFKEEKGSGPRQVLYDPHRQELRLEVSYSDNETKTSTATAKNLSWRLTGALSMIPATKYATNFMEDLSKEPITGRATELAFHTARLAMNAVYAPITYGLLLVGTNAPRPWETLGIITVMNLLDIVFDLNCAVKLTRGEPIDEKKIPVAINIVEKPFRVLYPASLVHELLLPTAKLLAHNSVTSAQLLKSNGE